MNGAGPREAASKVGDRVVNLITCDALGAVFAMRRNPAATATAGTHARERRRLPCAIGHRTPARSATTMPRAATAQNTRADPETLNVSRNAPEAIPRSTPQNAAAPKSRSGEGARMAGATKQTVASINNTSPAIPTTPISA